METTKYKSKKNKFFYFCLMFMLGIVSVIALKLSAMEDTTGNNEMNKEKNVKSAVFAAGCFWCIEPPFDKENGVLKTTAGYTGGTKETATYEQVSGGNTQHREVIEVVYDSSVVSYSTLLDIFWENIDPFNADGQFCDKGFQYSSAIYYNDEAEKKEAEEWIQRALAKASKKEKDKKVETSIEPANPFYAAEEYHQDYYIKNSYRYKTYRYFCGRDVRLAKIWPQRKK